MALYLIGMGLSEGDLTQKAINAIKKCDIIYVEGYTNKFIGDMSGMERACGKKITKISREKVESDFLLSEAKSKNVALLVAGDPLTATTHFEIVLEANKRGIAAEVVHASSVYSAISATGLHIYKFGRATTLASWRASSPYDVAAENKKRGLHTLLLLDTQEGDYMALKGALDILGELENQKKEKIFTPDAMLLACSCMGSKKQKIVYAKMKELEKMSLEAPITLVLPGDLHFKEEEALALWKKG